MWEDKEIEKIKQKAIGEMVERYMKDKPDKEKLAFATLLEGLLDAFMKGEREIFLSNNMEDKGNRFYERTISTGLGKLFLNVPRDRQCEFEPSILPGPWIRSSNSYEKSLASLIVNGFSRSNVSDTLKEIGLPYS